MAILIFLLASIFLGTLGFIRYLNKGFTSALSGSSDYSILGDKFPTLSYIVVDKLDSDPVIVKRLVYIVFDREGNKVTNYVIPVNLKVDLAGKYGVEEISKAFALGSLNSEDPLKDGVNVINNTLFRLVSFKVDKYLLVDEGKSPLFDELLGNGSFLDIFKLRQVVESREHFRTNLNVNEFYYLFNFIKSLPDDRLFSKDYESFEADVDDLSSVMPMVSEGKNIAVLNGSDVSGIAGFGARVVANLGGRVVAVGNSDKPYSASMIIADDPNSVSCLTLSRVFGIKQVFKKGQTNVSEHELDRSDIVVILGFDTSSELY